MQLLFQSRELPGLLSVHGGRPSPAAVTCMWGITIIAPCWVSVHFIPVIQLCVNNACAQPECGSISPPPPLSLGKLHSVFFCPSVVMFHLVIDFQSVVWPS